jgi:hypothetical protein
MTGMLDIAEHGNIAEFNSAPPFRSSQFDPKQTFTD